MRLVLLAVLAMLVVACGDVVECEVIDETRTYDSCGDLETAIENADTQDERRDLIACHGEACAGG